MAARNFPCRPVRACGVLLLLVVALGNTPTAAAQDVGELVEGARDFRTAPLLVDGTYRDVILTGEDLWYGVYITNDPDNSLHISARIETAGRDDWHPWIELIGPTLRSVAHSPASDPTRLHVERMSYGSSTDGESWLWFLRFRLDSDGRRGEEVPLEFEVAGAGQVDARPCVEVPGCQLDEKVADLHAQIYDLRTTVEAGPSIALPSQEQDLQTLLNEITTLVAERDALKQQLDDRARASSGAPDASAPGATPGAAHSRREVSTIVALAMSLAVLFAGITWIAWRKHRGKRTDQRQEATNVL